MKTATLKAEKLTINEYTLDDKFYFQWMQLIHTISLIWKHKINDSEKMLKKICRARSSPNKSY